MTAPTDGLEPELRRASLQVMGHEHPVSPAPQHLWTKGRRRIWAARTAAAGLVVAAVTVVATVALVMRPERSTLPADGSSLHYPQFVTDLFPGRYQSGPEPVFGWVVSTEPGNALLTRVIDRSGILKDVQSDSSLATNPGSLAPDGLHLLSADGVVDLEDGSLIQPNVADPYVGADHVLGRGIWAPDSQHVLIDTGQGPAVLDLFADVSSPPSEGAADDDIAIAGWRGPQTIIGVRNVVEGDQLRPQVVSRALTSATWTVDAPIALGPASRQDAPARVSSSPDGSHLLLQWSEGNGEAGRHSAVLVDSRSGRLLPLREGAQVATEWDGCTPVWRGNEPLRASGGLRNPADDTPLVMAFSDRRDGLGCVTLAGDQLTGSPDARSEGVVREQVWRVALPVACALALITAIWVVVALRRSRRIERPGKRWLPMIYVQRF